MRLLCTGIVYYGSTAIVAGRGITDAEWAEMVNALEGRE